MDANPRDYLMSTLDRCCTTFFGWNYDGCIGSAPGMCARALFYPDWHGSDEGCVDDGNEPTYMTDNAMFYIFSQLEDCCNDNYASTFDTCMGSAASSKNNGLYYPDFDSTDHVCRNNGKQPGYMNNSPTHWMHTTLAACCTTNYNWNYDNCIGSDPSSATSTVASPTGGLYYPGKCTIITYASTYVQGHYYCTTHC